MVEQEENAKDKRLVVIIDDGEDGISFSVVGMTMDEAIALVTKGYYKFVKYYEEYARKSVG